MTQMAYKCSKLFQLFINANAQLRYPTLVYRLPNDKQIKFSQTQQGNWRNYIWVSDGGKWPNQRNYARLHPNCEDIFWYDSNLTPELKAKIEAILHDPEKEMILNGKEYNYCCFCGTLITSEDSLFYGYGPICAGNWGLPWGDARERKQDAEVERLMNQVWKEGTK